jgi:hypothetical protein
MSRRLKGLLLTLCVVALGLFVWQDDSSTTSPSPAVAGDARHVATKHAVASAAAVDLFAPPGQAPLPGGGAASAPVAAARIDPPPPVTIAGVWAPQDGAAGRNGDGAVLFLDSFGTVQAACERCHVPGALHPGAVLAGGYRLDHVYPSSIELTRLSDGKHKVVEQKP